MAKAEEVFPALGAMVEGVDWQQAMQRAELLDKLVRLGCEGLIDFQLVERRNANGSITWTLERREGP